MSKSTDHLPAGKRREIEFGNTQRQPVKRRQQVAGGGADKIPQGAGSQIDVACNQVQEKEDRQDILEA